MNSSILAILFRYILFAALVIASAGCSSDPVSPFAKRKDIPLPTGTIAIRDARVPAKLYNLSRDFNPFCPDFPTSITPPITRDELSNIDPSTLPYPLLLDESWGSHIFCHIKIPEHEVAFSQAKQGNPFACVGMARIFAAKEQYGNAAFWLIQADLLTGKSGWGMGIFSLCSSPVQSVKIPNAQILYELVAGLRIRESNDELEALKAFYMGDLMSRGEYGNDRLFFVLEGSPLAMDAVGIGFLDSPGGMPLARRWALEAATRGYNNAWELLAITYAGSSFRDKIIDPDRPAPADLPHTCAAWNMAAAMAEKYPLSLEGRVEIAYDLSYNPLREEYCSKKKLSSTVETDIERIMGEWHKAYEEKQQDIRTKQKAYYQSILPVVQKNIADWEQGGN